MVCIKIYLLYKFLLSKFGYNILSSRFLSSSRYVFIASIVCFFVRLTIYAFLSSFSSYNLQYLLNSLSSLDDNLVCSVSNYLVHNFFTFFRCYSFYSHLSMLILTN